MTEYLLSVWMDGDVDAATVSEEDTQRMYAQVDVFNAKLQAEGKWVFAGGLTAASSATVVDRAARTASSISATDAMPVEMMVGLPCSANSHTAIWIITELRL